MVKWFVYYDYGYCKEMDHDSGLLEFDTEDEAITFVQELRSNYGTKVSITMIKGEERVIV